jgi:VanZ family protein
MEIIAGSYPSHLMRLLGRFLPPLALMGLIFFLSAQPDLKSGLGLADLILRKALHAAEFGLLWFLWLRALRWRAPGWAAIITLGYAASDEVHQAFVRDRVGSPLDWLLDAAGVVVAYWLWRRYEDRLRPVDRAQLPEDVVEVSPAVAQQAPSPGER